MPITSTTRSVISVDQKTGEIITGKNKQTKENNKNIVSSTPLKNNKFFEYDSNKDGKMDLNEFAKAYRSFESGGITKTTTTQNIRKQGGNIFNQTEEFVGSRLQEALPSYWNRPASSEDILKMLPFNLIDTMFQRLISRGEMTDALFLALLRPRDRGKLYLRGCHYLRKSVLRQAIFYCHQLNLKISGHH